MLATATRTDRVPEYMMRISKPPEGGWQARLDLPLVRADEVASKLEELTKDPVFASHEVQLLSGRQVGLQLFDKANQQVVIESQCYEDLYVVCVCPKISKSE